MQGKILTIAGSDSGGGAGIQADLKAAAAHGVYCSTAITALTAQNTEGVFGIHEVPIDFIKQQIELVLSDIGADVIKTGMLHNSSIIEVVAEVLKKNSADIPLIIDPVMIAKGGAPLLEEAAIEALKKHLLPGCFLVTPNIPEAEKLSDISITSPDDMIKAGQKICKTQKAKAVLVKGGHLAGDVIIDMLITADEKTRAWESPRINTRSTHGTGCTLASSIAALIAKSLPLEEAIEQSRSYVIKVIKSAPGLGRGHGPLGFSPVI